MQNALQQTAVSSDAASSDDPTSPDTTPSSHSVMSITTSDDAAMTTSHQGIPEQRAIAVEVPIIHNAEAYDLLPSSPVIRHALDKKRTTGTHLAGVESESSDKELISSSRLKNFSSGPRSRRRPQNEGFVSSETIPFSDEERPVGRASTSLAARRNLPPSIRRIPRPPSSPNEDGFDGYSSSSSPNTQLDIYMKRRSTRLESQRSMLRNSTSRGNLEEASNNSSEDCMVTSLVTGIKRRKKRKIAPQTSKRLKLWRSESDHSSQIRTGPRVSTRGQGVPRKSLKERRESDISENEAAPTEKRYSGAREVFQAFPEQDGFRSRHRNECEVCFITNDNDQKGPLVFCQGCTSSFHRICLGPRGTREHLVTKVGEDKFVLQCRRCIGIAHSRNPLNPHQGHCTTCKQPGPLSKPFRGRLTARQEQQLRENHNGIDPITIVDESHLDNKDNILFRCAACSRAFHFEHLPPMSTAANVLEGEESLPSNANARFKDYSQQWICHDCERAPGEIETLVAWRPVDSNTSLPEDTADMMHEADKEYLIKWKNMSYYHVEWMPGTWVWGVASASMRKAFSKSIKNLEPKMTTEEAVPEEYFRAEIVFNVRYSKPVNHRTKEIGFARINDVKEAYVKFKGLPYEDTVWVSIPDQKDVERWNDFRDAYQDWVLRDYIHVPSQGTLKNHVARVRTQNFESALVKQTQPKILIGGRLMDYQLEGLNWLLYRWYKMENAILADEMGLGKTIQVISLFATLVEDHGCWPFLVVCPNSTCTNWRREIKKWIPSLRVVSYYGSSVARRLAHDHEMFPSEASDLRCHILVTSYETMADEKTQKVFSSVPWAGLVVDEGHRLKNDSNQLYRALSQIRFPFRLLLTGTPLQNNTRELFNLIQFCDPTKKATALEEEYGTLTKENVPKLHDMIRPLFLRRTKAQVLSFLPSMAQIIVPVSMSVLQKKLYKSILTKNSQLIKSILQNRAHTVKQTERHSLSNILMQLRKCLCHPFLYSREIEERDSSAAVSHRNLVEASGKLKLLELMLPKLKERGHRVLIFSQFLGNLDIAEDFVDGLGLLHRRLDGSMSSLEKQKRIDEYNAPDSPYFAFLLSTRAGGAGINLVTADTVIIMDPDFNPHQDIQALSRAHRIGQEKKVLIFQLMTRGSAEERIMQIGKKKMVLDHVLIQKMDAEDEAGQDLESILRYGAEALFDDDNTGDIHYDSDSVDKLLDRSQAESSKTGGDDTSAESQFSFTRVWANGASTLVDRLENSESPPPDINVWEKILCEREQAAAEEAAVKAEALGRGKRKRNVVDYTVNVMPQDQVSNDSPTKPSRQVESDTEFNIPADDSETETEDDQAGPGEFFLSDKQSESKIRPFKRVDAPTTPPPNLDGNQSPAGYAPLQCLACNRHHPPGYCPLKLAGLEHCGLCGMAHFGVQRTCPLVNTEQSLKLMLDTLKESPESKDLVEPAMQYLRSVRKDLAKRRRQASKTSGNINMANQGASGSTAIRGALTDRPNVLYPPGQPNIANTSEQPSVMYPLGQPNITYLPGQPIVMYPPGQPNVMCFPGQPNVTSPPAQPRRPPRAGYPESFPPPDPTFQNPNAAFNAGVHRRPV